MIVAGLGFRKDASVNSLRDALACTGAQPQALATAADKAEAPAFRALAAEMGLPLFAISLADLKSQPTQDLYGTGSLAEAAALAAAGPNARLLGPRVISKDGKATAALAERSVK
jgi:cobalt-precorrin 5A hydrolase